MQNIMRTLPTQINPKVLVLEEKSDLDDLTMDALYGILTTYEMRTKPKNVSMMEVAFKATRKLKSNISECRNPSDQSDEEEVNLMRRLKRRQGKYKEKLPFKYFKCGSIRLFAYKCTYEN